MAACFGGVPQTNVGYPCLAVDCPDGAPVREGGRCVCSSGSGQGALAPRSPVFGNPACGALDCVNGAPMVGPTGCSCAAPTDFAPSLPRGGSGRPPVGLPKVPATQLPPRTLLPGAR
jgi:hypothetical protein